MNKVAILGSTGSIGTNCLNVVKSLTPAPEVRYLTTYRNVARLLEQAQQFHPRAVVVYDEKSAGEFADNFRRLGVELYTGFEGILEICRRDDFDILVNALVGAVGLKPTLLAVQANRRIALANKETLVIGGGLVMQKVRASNCELIPIDSEHSAVLQCLVGEEQANIRSVFLTASGGPFKDVPLADFPQLTVEQALNHPNWNMGPKITVDSATLMNKGLEVIEAHWLFDLAPVKIQVVIHPQSIIHSMVEFEDGSIKAQMGLPDMRMPIQYAMTFPRRLKSDFPRLDFGRLKELTFETPDLEKFRCLKLAYEALEFGGSAPAVLNAANEEAVNLFLNRKIRFDQIPYLVEQALEKCEKNSFETVEELLHYDQLTREFVQSKFS